MATSPHTISRRALLRGAKPDAEPRIRASDACLAHRGIVCEACRDICEAGAIRFWPALGRVATPEFDPARCTGCGDCAAICPAAAITLVPSEPHHAG